MSHNEKERLIAEFTALLHERLSAIAEPVQTPKTQEKQPVEMLTVQECSQEIKGLSVHTVRQLVAQGKIPHIRTGAGKHGKILISKGALLAYFGKGA